jgi:flagellar biosynthesis/type III secretory pathway protein FliH
MAFFFPKAYNNINWGKGYDYLDKELKQVVKDAKIGKRFVDKLIRVYRNNDEETWVLVHIEIQSQEDVDFSKRMYVYNYRIFDRYDHQVASFAVLGDENPSWHPSAFKYELLGSKVSLKFSVAKLLSYGDRWSELEKSNNPFSIVVMAHLKAQETRKKDDDRKNWKLYIIKQLYKRGYHQEYIIDLFSFIDWIIQLPESLAKEFSEEIIAYEEEMQMPYMTSVERIGIKKGLEQGIEQGLKQGLEQGIEQGLERGRKQGLEHGLEQGLERGMRQELWEGIELALELKFGEKGLQLMPEIREINEVNTLKTIRSGIKQAKTIADIRKIYQSKS